MTQAHEKVSANTDDGCTGTNCLSKKSYPFL